MAFRWRAYDGPTLNTGLVASIFQGIRAYIARIPYIVVIFHGGPGRPCHPPLWIRTWQLWYFLITLTFWVILLHGSHS